MKSFLAIILVGAFVVATAGCSKKTEVQTGSDTTVSTNANTRTDTSSGTSITTGVAANPVDTSTHAVPAADNVKVSLTNLPSTVKPYIEKNFSGYTAASAASDPLCGGAPAIDVSIKKKGSPTYSLIFKPDGTFVQKEQDVPLSSAPPAIVSAFKSKYSGFNAAHQIEKLTLTDNSVQYLLDISKGHIKKEVTFSLDGSVVCEGKD